MDHALSKHTRASSDVTDRSDTAATSRDLSPVPISEALLQRNIIVLAEKQQVFLEREKDLRRIEAALTAKRAEARAEVAGLTEKLARKSLRVELLRRKSEMQRVRKDAALKQLALKQGQIDIARSLPASAHRTTDYRSLQRKVIEAGESLLVLQGDIVTHALRVKAKETTLEEVQVNCSALQQKADRVRVELGTVRGEVESLEAQCRSQVGDVTALVKSASHTRTQLSAAELALKASRERVQRAKAALVSVQSEINEKKSQVQKLQSAVVAKEEQAVGQQQRIQRLLAAEDELDERVRGKLAADSHWKSLNYRDLRLILDTMKRIREQENRLHTRGALCK